MRRLFPSAGLARSNRTDSPRSERRWQEPRSGRLPERANRLRADSGPFRDVDERGRAHDRDRKSVGWGTGGSLRVVLGGGSTLNKKKRTETGEGTGRGER